MSWLALILAASAQSIDRFPVQATVDLTACTACDAGPAARGEGAWRVAVDPLLRSYADPADGSDLLLVDTDGRRVSAAVARGEADGSEVSLHVRRTEHPDVLLIDAHNRPIDGLRVVLPEEPAVAEVWVEAWNGRDWVRHAEPTLVWRHSGRSQEEVRFAPTGADLRVGFSHHYRRPFRDPSVRGLVRPQPAVQPVHLTVPVRPGRVLEEGWAQYVIDLPHALPARTLRPVVSEQVFERRVMVTAEPLEFWNLDSGRSLNISRARLGGATLDEVDIPLNASQRSDRLFLYVHTEGQPALDIQAVELELEGVELLLHDPGPGPFTLLAGAPVNTTPPADLQVALPELVRMAGTPLETTGVGPNPAYIPPEIRGALAEPGTAISLRDHTWRHPIEGEAGQLVRIPLPAEVLGRAREDLGDLRLVDSEGRQVPYLRRRTGVDQVGESLVLGREEEGARSWLRAPIADPSRPVATLSLSTDAPLFQRSVAVWRVRGGELEPLRVFQWNGADRPSTLTLDIEQRLGDELVLTIDNGDDPPLPITGAQTTWPAWELVARMPQGGMSLVYGDPRATAPHYDLSLLRQELVRRAGASATVGSAEALTPPAPSMVDRGVLFAGIGVLVAGLGGLTVNLVRGAPVAARRREEDAEGAGGPDPAAAEE